MTGDARRHPRIHLMGVAIDRVDTRTVIEHIFAELDQSRGGWIVTPNLDILRRLVKEPGFASLCEGATLRLADGMPLIWASRIRGTPLPERVAGSDLIWTLTKEAAARSRSVFLLGGNPGAAEDAARIFREHYPGLTAHTHYPPPGFQDSPARMQELIDALDAANAAIVYVALGSPKQEHLIQALRPRFPRAWFLGIGISFSFVSGEVRRAPRWMQRLGLEWVHRLIQEPRKLAKRYLVHGIPFGIRMLARSAWDRLRGAERAESRVPQAR